MCIADTRRSDVPLYCPARAAGTQLLSGEWGVPVLSLPHKNG